MENMIIKRIKDITIDTEKFIKGGKIDEDTNYDELTELRRSIQRMGSKLKESIEEKDKLVKVMDLLFLAFSHDVRTPLSIIRNMIYELEYENNEKRRKEIVDTIMEELKYIEKIAQQLLKIGRMRSNVEKINREWFNPIELINDILKNHGWIENVNLKVKDYDVEVYADPVKVMEIITNLIENAIKYSKGMIEVELVTSNKSFKVEVTSMGERMPKNLERSIFGKFETFDIKGRGLGLGMYICSEYVKMHGGKIWYRHEDGKNIFGFEIPFELESPQLRAN